MCITGIARKIGGLGGRSPPLLDGVKSPSEFNVEFDRIIYQNDSEKNYTLQIQKADKF